MTEPRKRQVQFVFFIPFWFRCSAFHYLLRTLVQLVFISKFSISIVFLFFILVDDRRTGTIDRN